MSNLKIYCQSCGFAHAYTMQKPNFCQKCGEALGGTIKNKVEASSPLELEEETFTNNLTKLECDFMDYTPNTQTLGSIIEQSEGARNPNPVSQDVRPRNTLSPEETLEELRRESSAIRPKSSN
jgi:hypothetical protein